MSKIFVSMAILGALIISQTASADNRRHRGYSSYGSNYSSYRYSPRLVNSYHYGRSRSYSNRSYYNRSYNRSFYNYSNRPRYNYNRSYNRSYNRRFRSRDYHYDAGSFVGGLILGSLFSSSYVNRNSNNYIVHNPPVRTTREVIYVNPPVSRSTRVTSTRAPSSGRSLLKDLQGNCFERTIDQQGNEVRVQLEDQECNF